METFAFPGREHYSQGTCVVWCQWKRLGLNYIQLFVAIFRRHERCNVLIFLHEGVYICIYNQGHKFRRQWFLAYKTLNFGAIFKIFCMFV